MGEEDGGRQLVTCNRLLYHTVYCPVNMCGQNLHQHTSKLLNSRILSATNNHFLYNSLLIYKLPVFHSGHVYFLTKYLTVRWNKLTDINTYNRILYKNSRKKLGEYSSTKSGDMSESSTLSLTVRNCNQIL